jgi:hypothetical protein
VGSREHNFTLYLFYLSISSGLQLAPLMKTSVLIPAEAQHRAVSAAKCRPADFFDLQPGAFFGWPKHWKDKLKEFV